MKAIKIKATPQGSEIAYKKIVVDIPEATRTRMKSEHNNKNIFFYVKTRKYHYTQSGYKVIIYNPGRYEFYHREPTAKQLKTIERNRK